MEKAKIILEYLKVLLSPQIIIGIITVIFFWLFKKDLKALFLRIAKIRLPGGSEILIITPQEDPGEISSAVRQVGKGEIFLSLLATSDISRLFAYFLLKSNAAEKPIPIEKFVTIVDPIVKMSTAELSSHVYGILHGMACCLEGFLIVENQTSVKLSVLPKNFERHLKVVNMWMEKRNPRVGECLRQIDKII